MKARFLAVLSALLVGQGLGLAERIGSNPGSIGREPPPLRNRSEDVLNPDGSMTFFRGGLYALRSNIGRRQRDELAFVPEVGLNVGVQLTRHLKLFVGYSFLWISTVARAGEQIDPVINVSQFPIRSGDGPLVGRARPAPKLHGTDFWAQGLNFGMELSY